MSKAPDECPSAQLQCINDPKRSTTSSSTPHATSYDHDNPIHNRAFLSHRPSRVPWRALISCLTIVALLFITWTTTSSLFEIPSDVSRAYSTYREAKKHYLKNKPYWDSKRAQFENILMETAASLGIEKTPAVLESMSPEVFLSFLTHTVGMTQERLELVSIIPKESAHSFTIILSKAEHAIWPLKIIVSLEAELSFSQEGISVLFTRLRRGSNDVATGLAWACFGSELEMFTTLPIISMKSSQ